MPGDLNNRTNFITGEYYPTAEPARESENRRRAEEALVVRLRVGNPGAVEELFLLYVPRLYRFVQHVAGSDTTDTEDIVQDTVLAALRGVGRFRGDSGLYTWLCAIARHKVQDYIEHQQRHRRHLVAEELEDLQATASPAPPLEGRILQRHALEQAMAGLPMDYRLVLSGKYMEGFTVRELAEIMGRSEKSVESLLTRAREALRAQLSGDVPGKG